MSEEVITPVETPLSGAGEPADNSPPARDWIPEAYRESEVLKGYDSADAVFKDLVGIKEMRQSADMGDLISVDPDDPESLKHVYNKLGRPEAADKYSFEPPDEKFSEYVSVEDISEFNQTAHELNLTQKQYEGLMKHLGSTHEKAQLAHEEYIANNVAVLEQRWGKAGSESFKENQTKAIEGLNATGSDFLVKSGKEDAQWASHPATLELLRWVGEQTGEDTPLTSNTIRNMEIKAMDSKDRIKEFKVKYKAELGNSSHPDHAKRFEEMMGIYSAVAKAKTFS